jgi:hypothetical protein
MVNALLPMTPDLFSQSRQWNMTHQLHLMHILGYKLCWRYCNEVTDDCTGQGSREDLRKRKTTHIITGRMTRSACGSYTSQTGPLYCNCRESATWLPRVEPTGLLCYNTLRCWHARKLILACAPAYMDLSVVPSFIVLVATAAVVASMPSLATRVAIV